MALSLLMVGCSLFPNYDLAGMFYGSSPNADERFEQSMSWTTTHAPLSFSVPDEYVLYVGADTHVDSTTHNLETFLCAYRRDTAAPFAIHLGDFINAEGNYPRFDSATHYMPADAAPRAVDTLIKVLGNHDIYFGQWREYVQYYHTATYWLETRSAGSGKPLDLFIVLDSSSGELGRKQTAWLEKKLEEKSVEGYRHIIVLTHTNFFKQDATQGHSTNFTIEETYYLTSLFTKYGVSMVWNGHDHSREITCFGNVTYITLDTMQDPVTPAYYMVANMGSEISYRFIEL